MISTSRVHPYAKLSRRLTGTAASGLEWDWEVFLLNESLASVFTPYSLKIHDGRCIYSLTTTFGSRENANKSPDVIELTIDYIKNLISDKV